jgi:hypothetical protein
MTYDDLIAGFTELRRYGQARFDWNTTGDLHSIRVAGCMSSEQISLYNDLLGEAGALVPASGDNRFIVEVFRRAGSLIDTRPGVAVNGFAIEASELTWHSKRKVSVQQWRSRFVLSTINDAPTAAILTLRKMRDDYPRATDSSRKRGKKLADYPANKVEEARKYLASQTVVPKVGAFARAITMRTEDAGALLAELLISGK